MPHLLHRLRIETTAARGIPDDAGIEDTVDGDPRAQIDVLLTAIIGMTAKLVDGEPKPGMPLHGTPERQGGGLDARTPITGIEDQRLHIRPPEPHRPMHLCLDVVVKVILPIGESKLHEPHPVRHSEIRGLDATVRITERGPRQRPDGQPKMRRPEPRAPPNGFRRKFNAP